MAINLLKGLLNKPVKTSDGIKVMSINLLMENEEDPVLWRGPIISGMVKQFWTDVLWEDLDYLVIDMPPGTGDVALTVMQSIPIDGVVMVSVPQDLVSMIVSKVVNMVKQGTMNFYHINPATSDLKLLKKLFSHIEESMFECCNRE